MESGVPQISGAQQLAYIPARLEFYFYREKTYASFRRVFDTVGYFSRSLEDLQSSAKPALGSTINEFKAVCRTPFTMTEMHFC